MGSTLIAVRQTMVTGLGMAPANWLPLQAYDAACEKCLKLLEHGPNTKLDELKHALAEMMHSASSAKKACAAVDTLKTQKVQQLSHELQQLNQQSQEVTHQLQQINQKLHELQQQSAQLQQKSKELQNESGSLEQKVERVKAVSVKLLAGACNDHNNAVRTTLKNSGLSLRPDDYKIAFES